jgi:hypothetical protein
LTTSKILRPPPWLGWPFWNICVTNDHGYVPPVISTSRSFPHSRLIAGFTKDRVTRTPLKTGGELRCSRRVSSSYSTSGTRCVNLVTNPAISREWGKDLEVLMTGGTYPCSFVTQIFQTGQQLSIIHSSMQTINYCYSCK